LGFVLHLVKHKPHTVLSALDKVFFVLLSLLYMTELLLKEKLLLLTKLPSSVREKLKGVLRIVDKEGRTYGLFLDREAMEELLEDLEYSSPEFWAEIEKSRKSGAVSSKEIERRLGL
jgi:hypothetical protein